MYVFFCFSCKKKCDQGCNLPLGVAGGWVYKMFIFLLIIVRWDRWTWVTWLEQATVRDIRSSACSLLESGT